MSYIRVLLSSALRRYLADPALRSARVLPAAGLSIEVTGSDRHRLTYNFDPAKATVELTGHQVLIWRDGVRRNGAGEAAQTEESRVALMTESAWIFESASAADLERLYRDIQKALRGKPRSRVKPVLVGALVGVAAILLAAPKAPTAPVSPAVAAVLPQVASPAAAVTPAQAVVTPEEAKLVSALKGVKLPGAGPAYYVFSDPNCPFCKELEKAVETVNGYQPVVLPLGYKNGSRDLSAAVMCSADPAREWKRAMAGFSTARPCEQGYQAVEANMQAFEKLGLSSTPTMVTPRGVLVTGAASPEELRALLQR